MKYTLLKANIKHKQINNKGEFNYVKRGQTDVYVQLFNPTLTATYIQSVMIVKMFGSLASEPVSVCEILILSRERSD